MEVFNQFDTDGSGELNQKEMMQMAAQLKISKEFMQMMIKEIDANGDGSIQAEEWLTYILDTREQMKINTSQRNTVGHGNYIDNQNKINRRKSVLHQVMENSLIEKDNDNNTSGQVSDWMKLKS